MRVRFTRVETIGRAELIGALAWDGKTDILYVAVPLWSHLSVECTNRKVSSFVSGLGEPRGMAIDAQNNRLLVSDATKRPLWAISLTSNIPQKVRVF